MSYRVSSISRRIYFTGLSGLGFLAVLSVIFSDPNGTQPASIALMSVLLAWLIALGIRGWRCATLLASGHQGDHPGTGDDHVRALAAHRSWASSCAAARLAGSLNSAAALPVTPLAG